MKELEQRLAASKEQTQQKDIQHRLAMQKMEAENRRLKTLLFQLGVSPEIIHQYTQAPDQDTELGRKVAIPAMQRLPETPSVSSSHEGSGTRSSSTVTQVPTDPIEEPAAAEQMPVNDGCCTSVPAPTQLAEQQCQPSNPAATTLCCSGSKSQANSVAAEDDVLNTTLCAIAEDWISQYNTRGMDMEGIRQRLCSGRKEQSSEGCRVQNHLLFQVLDEISNNI